MRWLIDGYNVIRRSPELSSREMVSLEGGRRALCDLLSATARASGDAFTVVFDGAGAGGTGSGGAGVNVVFSSARENADRVLIRLARAGGAVVSNDREVRQSVARAGAVVVTTDEFLARLGAQGRAPDADVPNANLPDENLPDANLKDEEEAPRGPRKGNPRRLGKKARAARRALGRLGRGRLP
jgi:predicted RNA-binding protein with PIN domain